VRARIAGLALLLAACGGASKPAARAGDADAPKPGSARAREVDPTDIFPADLDLVVRIDVARMRAGLGPTAADDLGKRALGDEEEARQAIACAEVVWIATRVADLDAGDHVLVAEGKGCMPDLLRARWEKAASPKKRVLAFDRKGEAPRGGTARILNLGDRAVAFVSPVEVDAVSRVLGAGPDDARGSPAAEGVVSVDLRARPLPPWLAKKYPSIGAIIAGVDHVRGSAVLADDGLRVDAQVLAKTDAGAGKATRFLEALRDSLAASPKLAGWLKEARVEQAGRTVAVKLTVPAKALLSLLSRDEPAPPPTKP
jgi:hypothetical protein